MIFRMLDEVITLHWKPEDFIGSQIVGVYVDHEFIGSIIVGVYVDHVDCTSDRSIFRDL